MIRSQKNSIPRMDDDPLIDEVRAIRRAICEEFGNDVDRLADHLREVEVEYATRTGRFEGLLNKTSEEVVASWGEEVNQLADPVVDEVRRSSTAIVAVRRGRMPKQTVDTGPRGDHAA